LDFYWSVDAGWCVVIPGVGSSPFGAEKQSAPAEDRGHSRGCFHACGLDRSTFVQCRKAATNIVGSDNQFAWRLSNTSRPMGQLMKDPHAILLANALIDNGSPLNFFHSKNLQAQVIRRLIVQHAGRWTCVPREAGAAGAQIVSYIPNNAYLVRISSGRRGGLDGQPQVQSVIPYEPYYKSVLL